MTFRGRDGVRVWWDKVRRTFEDVRWELLDLVEMDQKAVAKLRAAATLGGGQVDQLVWQAATFRDGRLTWWGFFRLYEDEHFDISVPELAEELGCEVAVADRCRLFLPRAEHYAESDSELDDFNDELHMRLVATGGARYADFSEMDFTAADIDVLHAVEEAASTEERMHFGFLHYYLLDARPTR